MERHFPSITPQEYNKYIKDLVKLGGIKQSVSSIIVECKNYLQVVVHGFLSSTISSAFSAFLLYDVLG